LRCHAGYYVVNLDVVACGAKTLYLGATVHSAELGVHFLKSFQKECTCENLSQKSLKSKNSVTIFSFIFFHSHLISCTTQHKIHLISTKVTTQDSYHLISTKVRTQDSQDSSHLISSRTKFTALSHHSQIGITSHVIQNRKIKTRFTTQSQVPSHHHPNHKQNRKSPASSQHRCTSSPSLAAPLQRPRPALVAEEAGPAPVSRLQHPMPAPPDPRPLRLLAGAVGASRSRPRPGPLAGTATQRPVLSPGSAPLVSCNRVRKREAEAVPRTTSIPHDPHHRHFAVERGRRERG
jgi:hypothetical protein